MLLLTIQIAELGVKLLGLKRETAHYRSVGDQDGEDRVFEEIAKVLKDLARLKARLGSSGG